MNPNIAGMIAISMWSISPLLIISAGDTPAFLMGFITLTIASLTLFCRSYFSKHNFKEIVQQPLIAYLLTTYGIGGYIAFWFLGFKNAPAFEANTLNYLWPVLLVLFSHLAAKHRLSFSKVVGLFAGFVGTVILFSQGREISGNGEFFLGYVFALLGAIVWSTYSTATRYIHFPNRSMAVFTLVPGIICLIFHLILENFYVPKPPELFFLVILGLTRVSFAFWDYAMKHGQIVVISSLSYFIPIISTSLLMVCGFVPRNEIVITSATLVIGGCLLVNARDLTELLRKAKGN